MKKTSLLLITFFLFLYITAYAQLNEGEFAFGGYRYDCAYTILQTMNGDYVLSGTTMGEAQTGIGSSYLVNLDGSGNIKWIKSNLNTDTWSTQAILIYNVDQQYIVATGTNSWNSGAMYAACIDMSGNLIWYTSIVPPASPWANSLTQGKNGDIFLVGTDGQIGPNSDFGRDINYARLSSAGGALDAGIIADTNMYTLYQGNSVIAANDSGYLIAGAYMDNAGNYLGLFDKLDSADNLQFARVYKASSDSNVVFNSLIKTKDKGYAVAGFIGATSPRMFIMKLDSSYNVKWAEAIGGANDTAYSIFQTLDRGYVIAGVTHSYGHGSGDVYVVRLDSAGNVVWQKAIGGSGEDAGNSIIETSDKGYAIGGFTSFGKGKGDLYFVKLDSNGNSCNAVDVSGVISPLAVSSQLINLQVRRFMMSTTGNTLHEVDTETVICKTITYINEEHLSKQNVQLYPNPNNGSFSLSISNYKFGMKSIVEIYNVMGEKVFSGGLISDKAEIELSDKPSGIYLYRVITETSEPVAQGMFIIQ